MANEYTPNYNLDLYTDNDKPNLRDQYNGAITKIDTQLHEFSNNMVIITDSANQAREKAAAAQAVAEANTKSISTLNTTVTEMDSAYKAADEKLSSDITGAYKAADTEIVNGYKDADTKLSKDITDAYKAADTEIVNGYKSADTSMNDSLMETINSHFPIKSGDIQAGAITRDKLDAQALESIIKGITIRYFDSEDSTADNEGLVVPNDKSKIAGYYLPELTMLVLTKFDVPIGGAVENANTEETTSYRLPSYIPHMTKHYTVINPVGIKYDSNSNFKDWTGVTLNHNGYIGCNSSFTASDNIGFSMAGNAVVFLRAFGVA